MSDANERTCATMDAMVSVAKGWAPSDAKVGPSSPPPEELVAWVRLRMQAYTDGGWDGERAAMIDWIAMDLAVDEGDAATLCECAGWPS